MRSARLLVLAGLLVQLVELRSSYAYKLEPISRVFAPTGSNATQSFEISNDGSARIALTVSIRTLSRDEQYNEISTDAEDEFLVYPTQLVLSPGKRQTLRVTWLGDAKPSRELTYRIVVEQIPIAMLDKTVAPLTESTGNIKVLVTYRGTLFVRPPGAKPNIALEATRVGTKQVKLTLINRGTAVGLVRSCTLRLTLGNNRVLEVPATVLAVLNNNRVLAGGRRSYTVELSADIGPLKAVGQCAVKT